MDRRSAGSNFVSPAAAAGSSRPGRWSPALSSLTEPSPSRASLFLEAAFLPCLGSTATDPQASAAAAPGLGAPASPGAPAPLGGWFPRSAWGKPLVGSASLRLAGRPGLLAPKPLRLHLARCRAARGSCGGCAQRGALCGLPWAGAHRRPLVARVFRSRATIVDTDPFKERGSSLKERMAGDPVNLAARPRPGF